MGEVAGADEEWVDDEGGWEEDHTSPLDREKMPDGWMCHIRWARHAQVFKVSYKSDDGAVLKSQRDVKEYLKGRPDLNRESVKVKFSQAFARKVVLHGRQQQNSQRQAAASAAPIEDDETAAVVLENLLKEGGEINFGGVGRGTLETKEMTQLQMDEELAKRLQAEENRRARGGFGWESDHDFDSEGEDYDDSDDEIMGDVAAGGWRVRESQQQEGTAAEEDVSCLEVKRMGGDEVTLEGHCPVCQEAWKEGDDQRVLPCGHGFHPLCVDRWLRDHKAQCPLCKKDIREDWEDEDEEVWDPIAGKWVRESGGDHSSVASGEDEDEDEDEKEGQG